MNYCEHCDKPSNQPESELCQSCGIGRVYFDRRNASPVILERLGFPIYTGCCDAERDYLAVYRLSRKQPRRLI